MDFKPGAPVQQGEEFGVGLARQKFVQGQRAVTACHQGAQRQQLQEVSQDVAGLAAFLEGRVEEALGGVVPDQSGVDLVPGAAAAVEREVLGEQGIGDLSELVEGPGPGTRQCMSGHDPS